MSELVNDWIDKKIHPITGFKHSERDVENSLYMRGRPRRIVIRNKEQKKVIARAKSISAKKKHGTNTKEDLEWLEYYKKNKEEILSKYKKE